MKGLSCLIHIEWRKGHRIYALKTVLNYIYLYMVLCYCWINNVIPLKWHGIWISRLALCQGCHAELSKTTRMNHQQRIWSQKAAFVYCIMYIRFIFFSLAMSADSCKFLSLIQQVQYALSSSLFWQVFYNRFCRALLLQTSAGSNISGQRHLFFVMFPCVRHTKDG